MLHLVNRMLDKSGDCYERRGHPGILTLAWRLVLELSADGHQNELQLRAQLRPSQVQADGSQELEHMGALHRDNNSA